MIRMPFFLFALHGKDQIFFSTLRYINDIYRCLRTYDDEGRYSSHA
ncbi:hypothetical protein CSUI_009885, partial [Cystoisospora suis]